MQLDAFIQGLQEDLQAAAALGDERTAATARQLSLALESSLRVRVFDLLAEAALELSGSTDDGHVEVRVAGRDPQLVFVPDAPAPEREPAQPLGGEDGGTARITLRLPEGLKLELEGIAGREGLSVNTWLVRAIARAIAGGAAQAYRSSSSGPGRRLRGFAQG
jgi:hypothetical protein